MRKFNGYLSSFLFFSIYKCGWLRVKKFKLISKLVYLRVSLFIIQFFSNLELKFSSLSKQFIAFFYFWIVMICIRDYTSGGGIISASFLTLEENYRMHRIYRQKQERKKKKNIETKTMKKKEKKKSSREQNWKREFLNKITVS